ncbi:putative ATPase [Pseudonocardia alni]|uniref:ATPase n=4 Tax=Pseudonocardia TaxID=1847 RepID=A0AA44ZPM9_PSEA5|nr:putative ATPase [Pseudonocardia alni]
MARATMRSMTAGATHGDGAPGPDPDELVGRADELAGLLRDLDAARAGRARAVLLAGEAGIGKSRLATALGRAAAGAGAQVVVGRCLDAGGAALPYLPFSEVLDALARAGTALRPVLHGLLPGAAEAPRPATGDGDSGRLQVFDAVAGAVRDAAATAPLLVVLEDLHWADRSTRELLAFLLARLGSQRLLVLGTYRSDDLHRRHPLRASLAELIRLPAVRRVELGPLTPDAVLALVRARAATGGVDEATLRRIAARSEGNAFYAEELVAAGSDGLPGGLADVLLTRLDRLGGPAREVLRVASLAERSIPHDLLRDASELSAAELEAGLREAVSHHLLVPDPAPGAESYAFRHALLREAVHDDLLPAERVRLHARLTALLAGRDDDPGVAAALARHALAAHDLPRALAASVRAAEEAHRRHGPAEMLAHAERALELWSAVEDPERLTGVSESALTREAAWAASASGDPERGIALGARAVRVADLGEDPHARAGARRHYAMRLLDSGARVDAAVAAATEAVELLAGGPPGTEPAWAHAVLARAHLNADHAEPAWSHARASLAVARAVHDTAPPAEGSAAYRDLSAVCADALITLAFCARMEGDPQAARDRLAGASSLAAASGNRVVELRTVWNRGVSFIEDGLLDAAADELAEGARRAAAYGLLWGGYGLEFRIAQVRVDVQRGEWDAAVRTAADVDPTLPLRVTGQLAVAGALVGVARGDLDGAEELLSVLATEPPVHDQAALLQGVVGAESARWRGDAALAVDRVATALGVLRAEYPHHLGELALCALGAAARADLAEAARTAGDPAGAEAHAGAAAGLADEAALTAERGLPRGTAVGPEGRAWLARARAEAARAHGEAAPQVWDAVVETFAGYGDGYRAAEARWRRAEALLGRAHRGGPGTDGEADRRAAAEDLAVAATGADRLGARPLAEAVAALRLRAGDGGPRPAPPSGAGGSPLTPREHAVLELVAHGLTNRAVGERLFISEKTVSVHLSRAMAKLGASGRAEAVALAHSRGLLTPRD